MKIEDHLSELEYIELLRAREADMSNDTSRARIRSLVDELLVLVGERRPLTHEEIRILEGLKYG